MNSDADRDSEPPRRKKLSVAEAARLARVFGDTLPATTRDERTPEPNSGASDDWLRSQVPPHHG
ncbi:hypothetical protein IU501_00490 [Nocardia otitidiscaviarum]|uniref:Uncharacterized protein n=1 Tax=Nocardia otitidiscaviarum TaxID=1823 RepID=A0A516NFB6_9NOCA|nr:hypothetical protein [Nocardia otitidiscaviarum]MBF6131484.1 hypothetical protein [Nocardia otitidiscaviarum]MBF6178468.1 hypothetical protein [Nocardia otitidiscaviarum]MBF6240184.1 hypothetical protein [Nocardia otitidiscaviarum]MBF6482630.1 hypothetical protein [Nocardia otitidiscaviarum]MCP9622889.1 hypothetical protein [Nocardia otitidiscaviarum]